jgi:aspartate aminotransferase
LIKAMVMVQGHVSAGISTVGQAAAAAALDGPQEGVGTMIAAYAARRDLVVEALNRAPGLVCHKPQGAFYVYPNVAGCLGKTSGGGRAIGSDEDLAMALLEEAHVAAVHGGAFGMSPYLRISYATGDADLREACARIVAFCQQLH